jgi:galactokinase
MTPDDRVVQAFRLRFGAPSPIVVRAPGRVNLIGEHTDYNDGFVLPMAIDRAIWIALRPRDDREVHVYSADFEETTHFALHAFQNTSAGWAEYLKGVAWSLQEAGYALQGWEGVVAGDVPRGAGLSSSAALELAAARAFAAVSDLPWDAREMAKLCQRAENDWVGMKCGIMDQMISAAGQADHALLIDCRSLQTELVPLPPETVVVVLDTTTRRGLVDSAYNERRTQCEAAAGFFNVPALRDVGVDQFEAQSEALDEVTRRRARHVITENKRTLQAAEAMRCDDPSEMGCLMNASHASLRDDFEVSSEALNTMVACAVQEEGCYGARMTGAGFGGCAVALVHTDHVDVFATRMVECYSTTTGAVPNVYRCAAAGGAEVLSGTNGKRP